MKPNLLLGAVAVAAALTAPAHAALIDFESQTDPSCVQPAIVPTDGVSFTNAVLATEACSGVANTPSPLSPLGTNAAFYFNASGGPMTMTLNDPSKPFTNTLSFWYTSPFAPSLMVEFLGDSPIAPLSLELTTPGSQTPYSDWKQYTSDDLTGRGITVVRWSGAPNFAAIDGISFEIESGPEPVPAPASLLLVALGLLGLRRAKF